MLQWSTTRIHSLQIPIKLKSRIKLKQQFFWEASSPSADQEIPLFNETKRHITVFNKALHHYLSRARLIQSTRSHHIIEDAETQIYKACKIPLAWRFWTKHNM
jgi:hypothetical protein